MPTVRRSLYAPPRPSPLSVRMVSRCGPAARGWLAPFARPDSRSASGRSCGTSSRASVSGILNGCFPDAGCRSTKWPAPSTSPIRAGPKSSPGSTSSRCLPENRETTPSRKRTPSCLRSNPEGVRRRPGWCKTIRSVMAGRMGGRRLLGRSLRERLQALRGSCAGVS